MSPSGDDVRRQLERLLASSVFANAGRMSRFLKFVVEQTLAGHGERLKEYVIGLEVFDRDASYDPRVDAIVRVEAARLRSKLAEYYAGEGHGDPIVLSLPKGRYAPAIGLAERASGNGLAAGGVAESNGVAAPLSPPTTAALAPSPTRRRATAWLGLAAVAGVGTLTVIAALPALAPPPALRVAVLPFAADGDDRRTQDLAVRLTEGVTAELVRTGRFAVVATSAARAAATPGARQRDIAASLDADVLVEARVSTGGEHVRVEARAASGALEQKLWVEGFVGSATDTDALEYEIAAAFASSIAANDR